MGEEIANGITSQIFKPKTLAKTRLIILFNIALTCLSASLRIGQNQVPIFSGRQNIGEVLG
jgi:hypothetical protein